MNILYNSSHNNKSHIVQDTLHTQPYSIRVQETLNIEIRGKKRLRLSINLTPTPTTKYMFKQNERLIKYIYNENEI